MLRPELPAAGPARALSAILLDIEGTTTPLSFVHDILFPYARTRLAPFIRQSWAVGAHKEIAELLVREHAADAAAGEQPPAWRTSTPDELIASAADYCAWLMDRDRKSPALKHLQGLIWDRGYDEGELHGIVFPDVPPAFRRWRDERRTIAIYSSGSELAQRRLFATTEYGDLTPFISTFFDTSVGPKLERSSYASIAGALGLPAGDICFISDVTRELTPARDAGFDVLLAVRPGNAPQEGTDAFVQVANFESV